MIDPRPLDELVDAIGVDSTVHLVDTWLHDLDDQLTHLQLAVAAADRPTLVRRAHSLKGTSATFGLDELRDACAAVECDAQAGVFPDVRRLAAPAERARVALLAWRRAASA